MRVTSSVCLAAPDPFFAVGEWYRDFSPTSDDVVVDLLCRASSDRHAPTDGHHDADAGPRLVREDDVVIPCGASALVGWLAVPEDPTGTVLFAHGSGSSRHSPRNRFVAASLHGSGLATLLLDLLSPEEARDKAAAFDIGLLASRLGDATRWVADRSDLSDAPVGYFGASTGAAAALRAAAQPGSRVAAVVSRGGRPDLTGPALAAVAAPTLLIVGERDEAVLDLNRTAQAELTCESHLTVVPGATHLFEEPGALESVAGAARDWFVDKLVSEHS